MLLNNAVRRVSPEWEMIRRLRSHRNRLRNKPRYSPLDEDSVRRDSQENALHNCLEFIEAGLRHTLRRNDLDILLNTGLDGETEKVAQTVAERLCAALDRVVNTNIVAQGAISDKYARMNSLLDTLDGSKWQFEMVLGAAQKLFLIESLAIASNFKETVEQFNDFFTKLTRPAVEDFRPPDEVEPPQSVESDPLMTAFKALTTLLSRLNDLPTCRHQVLLRLLHRDDVNQWQGLPGPDLDLFLSDCRLSCWQWSLFKAHLSIDQELWQRAGGLCDEIIDTYDRAGDLHLAFSDDDIFVYDGDASMNKKRLGTLAGSIPSKTLKQLLRDYAFTPDDVRIPGSKSLFGKREKRALAASLVFSLAACVGPGPVVKCWDAGSIYFLSSRDGKCLQELPYARCMPQQEFLHSISLTANDRSIEDVIFPQLAKLLMEIECGFELPHIKTNGRADDPNTKTLEDIIYDELDKDLGRASYLEAVQVCLKFRATYEHRAKRMHRRGQSNDYLSAARKITYASIITKIQHSPQETSNLKRSRDSLDGDTVKLPPISSDANDLGMASGLYSETASDSETRVDSLPLETRLPRATKKVRFQDDNETNNETNDETRRGFKLSLRGITEPFHKFRRHLAGNGAKAAKGPYSHDSYSVGWICALPIEMAACKAMLDVIHPELPGRPRDQNHYTLGQIGVHNVVIACLPTGVYGTTSATAVAMDMSSSFPSLRFGMMVGIAGGVPSKQADIRLGDVVVGKPTNQNGGVLQPEMGKMMQGAELHMNGTFNKPPPHLLTAISKLQADNLLARSKMCDYLQSMEATLGEQWCTFRRPDRKTDRLFLSEYTHVNPRGDTCAQCLRGREQTRKHRSSEDPKIHYGPIASGNQLIRDSVTRDRFADQGILCVEMESAGLMDRFPCLVVRGICDYADSHKNKEWQGYAAATAAACAKEILSVVR